MHNFVRLLQLAGLLGMGLSLLGMGLAVYFRLDFVMKQAQVGGGPETGGGMLQILDAFREPARPSSSPRFCIVAEIAAPHAVSLPAARPTIHLHDRPA